ncbi:MAG: response regulator transcription factor [Bacteroidetes bacterium]|nr:response regulator transcription factor [Bacteroidota bacterium]
MSEVIHTVLIDDDRTVLLALKSLLEENFPEVEVMATASSVKDGIKVINKSKPDLVLLDISLPDGEGFEVFGKTEFNGYRVIFITAHDNYAIKAFELSALHYLVKPVGLKDLQVSIDRFRQSQGGNYADRVDVLKEGLQNKIDKIIIPSFHGLNVVKLVDIIRMEADDVYTSFYLVGGKKLMASKPLNNYERLLIDMPFSRIHSKHLINLLYVKKYVKGKGGSVILDDGTEVNVSVRKKADFLQKLKNYARLA